MPRPEFGKRHANEKMSRAALLGSNEYESPKLEEVHVLQRDSTLLKVLFVDTLYSKS